MYRLLSLSLLLPPSLYLQPAKEAGNDHDRALQGEMIPITRDRDLGAQVPVEAEVEAEADLSIRTVPSTGQETSLGRVARQSLTTDQLLELLFLNLVREFGLVPGLRSLKQKYSPHLDHRQNDPRYLLDPRNYLLTILGIRLLLPRDNHVQDLTPQPQETEIVHKLPLDHDPRNTVIVIALVP